PSRSSMELLSHRAPLDPLLARRDDHPVHEDSRRVDAFRIELARLDELLDLRDGHPAGGRRHRVEVPGSLPVDAVAQAVALPRGHEREVADDSALEDVLASVESLRL